MIVSLELDGKRGKKFFVKFSAMGRDVGGGVLIELVDDKQKTIASGKAIPDEGGSRLLACWLTDKS